MLRRSTLLSVLALGTLAACTSPETRTMDPAHGEPQASTEEALDPNDPNVVTCPVTGAMQRLDPSDPNYVHPETDM